MTPAATVTPVRAWVQHIMGMPISVHVRAEDTSRPDIAEAVAHVFAHLRRADAVFSLYREDSDLMRWRSYDLEFTDADPWLAEVWLLCERAVAETGGVFTTDLTGPDGTAGWDPTGVVKGWAVATAADHLRSVAEISFSLNAGGDIVCGLGRNCNLPARPWRIGIENPADRTTLAHVVSVTDGAVATSGAAARGHHIIDPRSGLPVRRAGSTTVVGPSLVWADVWATATFVDPQVLDRADGWADYELWVTD